MNSLSSRSRRGRRKACSPKESLIMAGRWRRDRRRRSLVDHKIYEPITVMARFSLANFNRNHFQFSALRQRRRIEYDDFYILSTSCKLTVEQAMTGAVYIIEAIDIAKVSDPIAGWRCCLLTNFLYKLVKILIRSGQFYLCPSRFSWAAPMAVLS